MRPSVLAAFPAFTRKFEGELRWMYLDRLAYVTTGYGNKIDSPPEALALPWRRPDGSLASRAEIVAAWALVKSHRERITWGGGHYQEFTTIRLDEAAVEQLMLSKLARHDAYLSERYPEFSDWPACAQLAVHSLAWACGAAYKFPRMDRALEDRDFETASREIEMTPESNPDNDLTKRNRANQLLMQNAERVRAFHLDPNLLNWTYLIDVADEPTQPSVPAPCSASAPTIYVEPLRIVHADPSTYLGNEEPEPDGDGSPPDAA